MSDDPKLQKRNLWFVFQRITGMSLAEIAEGAEVSVKTVLRGIGDATGYPHALRLGHRDVQGTDEDDT